VIFLTQSASTTAPKAATILIIWAATLRHSLLLEGSVAGAASGLGDVFSADGGDVESLIGISIFEKDQPNGQREENRQARNNQRFEAQMGVNSKADQNQPHDEGEGETKDNAHHPRGKIRADHVHGRRMSTTTQ
jgi:hypothetical protein